MGPTVPPWMKLHTGKKFGRGGSHCTTREELERRQVPLCHLEETVKEGRTGAGVGPTVKPGTNLHVGRKFGRGWSHCG